ncbi:hypothetical protein SBY92_005116 [Candida maltosa Xu316]|uniref:DUF218 domain-containing protein n=1 Tax=Candida maltosa (strain Xu316) TaxID=1245528 RepID=M3IMZ5_CANMX|nr:hypothetical protein G210_1779 [Candida maltosa Xu316]
MTNHLIILPCHSIWKPGPTLGDSRDEWYLVDFQIEGYDHLSFKQQIQTSLKELAKDPDSYLIISGGETKREAGPISESLSYYLLAAQLCKDPSLLSRISTEVFARDSFENVIFSICRYYELFGQYPEKITIVGFEFKRERFITHHLNEALLFPTSNVVYIGNSPDPKDLNEEQVKEYFEDLQASEYKFAVQHFQKDWYGNNGGLVKKKINRNPFNRFHGYTQSNPKLSRFLSAIHDQSDMQNESIRELLLHMPWII